MEGRIRIGNMVGKEDRRMVKNWKYGRIRG